MHTHDQDEALDTDEEMVGSLEGPMPRDLQLLLIGLAFVVTATGITVVVAIIALVWFLLT